MKTFRVHATEHLYLFEEEIEAENAEEATEIYLQLVRDGEVASTKSDLEITRCEEVTETLI